MLAKRNRVVRADDFRAAVRSGRRAGMDSAVIYVRRRDEDGPVRFGFIVAKNVGTAVVRNRVRRRFRAAGRELLPSLDGGRDIVVRALPGSDALDWATLREGFGAAIERGTR